MNTALMQISQVASCRTVSVVFLAGIYLIKCTIGAFMLKQGKWIQNLTI